MLLVKILNEKVLNLKKVSVSSWWMFFYVNIEQIHVILMVYTVFLMWHSYIDTFSNRIDTVLFVRISAHALKALLALNIASSLNKAHLGEINKNIEEMSKPRSYILTVRFYCSW